MLNVRRKIQVVRNRIYRYDLDNKNNVLINPKLLLSVPSFPYSAHIGGIIDIGPDNNLYATIGNFQHTIPSEIYRTKTQNYENGEPVDGRAGVLRITQDGKPVGNGIIGSEYPLNLYYAYGVKNSFGIDFDPVTKKLWLTENGPDLVMKLIWQNQDSIVVLIKYLVYGGLTKKAKNCKQMAKKMVVVMVAVENT